MADDQLPFAGPALTGEGVKRTARHKVIWVVAVMALIAALCVTGVMLMIERLEARNANFHPPMTELERQQLMPAEPRLDISPSVEGLRYADEADSSANEIYLSVAPGASGAAVVKQSLGGQSQPFERPHFNETARHTEGLSPAH
ncbi:hypothetical protein [Pseudomonas huanghezhanensis]|uniref:hypothetical protein n=1 Tax=Pseudomonas huanghezhanensis TaxID=3002903 RepID=UPI0022857C10|nr:hypothetical protein [Pseudomonas sp. BSw22131]